MELHYEVEDLTTVPEAVRGFYVEKDGKHILAVKGVVPETEHIKVKTSLSEFRTNNTTLLKEQGKFKALASLIGEDGLDPDKLQTRINALAEQRVVEMKTAFETEKTEVSQRLAQTASQLETFVLTDAVTKAALKSGVVQSAIPDVVARARSAFVVVDGAVQARDAIKNKKGDALSVDDWMTSLGEQAPHFFGTTSGAGASRPASVATQPGLTTHEKLVQGLARLRK